MKASINQSVPVLMFSGMGDFKREVKSVFYWDGVTPVEKPATTDLVAWLIIRSNHEKSNAIVTSEGKMYLSFDTPGYCDGESVIVRML